MERQELAFKLFVFLILTCCAFNSAHTMNIPKIKFQSYIAGNYKVYPYSLLTHIVVFLTIWKHQRNANYVGLTDRQHVFLGKLQMCAWIAVIWTYFIVLIFLLAKFAIDKLVFTNSPKSKIVICWEIKGNTRDLLVLHVEWPYVSDCRHIAKVKYRVH